ncbi:DUF2934 domain-containing protein [Halodurantibacterium flavum]|uniref:DUF2934 domain-containing protein n=1 Tax=Halodurantibacterium flavum TaxID=1382802 RepID=A0ABW4SCY6_9RHOB
MNQQDFKEWESRIEARAQALWAENGKPDGALDEFREKAKELVALEEVPEAGHQDPHTSQGIEEQSLQENLGEFPGLRDQGDDD